MSDFIDQTARAAGAAYFAGKPAWHGLGVVTQEAKTSREVIHLAGMDWEVQKVPHFYNWNVEGMDDDGKYFKENQQREVPGSYLTVRSDTGAVLGVGMSDKYTIVNNRDAFDFMDDLVGSGDTEVRYESAGSLKDGRVIWVLARIGEAKFVCDGDPQIPYVLLSTTHDGTGSVRIQGTPVRVVCWNTLTMAQSRGRRQEISHYSIRHVGDLQARVAAARDAIGLVLKGFDQYIETGSRLAEVKVAADKEGAKVQAFMKAVFPAQLAKNEPSTRIQNIVTRVMKNWLEDPRQTKIDGANGTAWGLLNATTQYFDHDRTTKSGEDDEKRAENLTYGSWFGEPAKAKARAYEAAQSIFLDEKKVLVSV